jgi:hypothetical protein
MRAGAWQVERVFACKHKALSSNSSTTKGKKERKRNVRNGSINKSTNSMNLNNSLEARHGGTHSSNPSIGEADEASLDSKGV